MLAGVGIFLPPVKEILPNALTNIIVRKTTEAIVFAAQLVPGRNGNCILPLLKWDEDEFISSVFYFVLPLIDEQEWCFVRRCGGGVGYDFAVQ